MKQFFILITIILSFTACSIKHDNIKLKDRSYENKKIKKLARDILSLSKEIDKKEALKVSYDAITYSKYLANKFQVVKPALFHNTLINLNLKEKGFCYHYANELQLYLKTKKFKTFNFIRAVANRGEYFEHSSLVLTRDDVSFENSIILDAWRDSGELFWSKVKDDVKYKWEKK
ncbi:hypothetical protein [Arcobacter sp. LA11]|uniref:hypothetical protein n=1 Tax=Arcobacter sp. LA11 TaxID=1898176 RepID=UPI0009F9C7AF|nr:hypothetical protein [Arcobacter sp. LA11]